MKKYLALIICIILECSLVSQEKYMVPALSGDQKLIGNIIAPIWETSKNFEEYVTRMISNFESMRLSSDPALIVTEDKDGSVRIGTNTKMWFRYIPQGNGFSTYDELSKYLSGVNAPIAEHMGAIANMELHDTLFVFSIRGSTQATVLHHQEQINATLASLTRAKTKKTIGIIMTIVGAPTFIAGVLQYHHLYSYHSEYKEPPSGDVTIAGAMIAFGAGIAAVGINLWARGGHNKRQIEAEKVKFNGSASANGVGLKIRF